MLPEKLVWQPQDHQSIDAQILLGSDLSYLHLKDALNKKSKVIETKSARLKISIITGKYLVHRHNSCNVVECITIEDQPQSDDESVGGIALPSGSGFAPPVDESIPMEIVEALVHSSMGGGSSSHSHPSCLLHSATMADALMAGCPDDIQAVGTEQCEIQVVGTEQGEVQIVGIEQSEVQFIETVEDDNQVEVEIVLAARSVNLEEIEIITIDSEDDEFEEQLLTVAPQL